MKDNRALITFLIGTLSLAVLVYVVMAMVIR